MELIEKNKALVQRYIAAYNRHDLEAMDTILAPTYVDHAQPAGQPPQLSGREIKKQIYAVFFQSFPDAHWTIEDLLAEGDKVAVRLTMTGTQQEMFLVLVPAGHEAEAARIIERFRTETIASLKKDVVPAEP